MVQREGGSWLCDVSPADVEDGLGYHEYKYLHMSIERSGLKYWITIAKTSIV